LLNRPKPDFVELSVSANCPSGPLVGYQTYGLLIRAFRDIAKLGTTPSTGNTPVSLALDHRG
jgi:hypothetical protein